MKSINLTLSNRALDQDAQRDGGRRKLRRSLEHECCAFHVDRIFHLLAIEIKP